MFKECCNVNIILLGGCLQMPEIKSIVNSFADDMIKDIENKVLQDNWVKMKCANSEVTLPQRAMPKSAEEPRHIPVSDSISKPKSGTLPC